MKNWWLFCPLVIHISALWGGLTALKFAFTWVRRKGPPGPPKYEKKVYYFHILGLNLKISYQIASLLDMYIDMGERISEKQDRPSVIIEHPLRAPQIAQNIHIFCKFWLIYEQLVFKLFPLLVICLHCDEFYICWQLGAPTTLGFYVRAQHDPEKNEIYFICIFTKRFLSDCFYF